MIRRNTCFLQFFESPKKLLNIIVKIIAICKSDIYMYTARNLYIKHEMTENLLRYHIPQAPDHIQKGLLKT